MAKKGNFKQTAKKVLKIVAFVLVGALSTAGVVSIAKGISEKSKTYKLSVSDYSDEYLIADGKEGEPGGEIIRFEDMSVTQSGYKCQLTNETYLRFSALVSIDLERDEEKPIRYQVNYYDEDQTWLGVITPSDDLTELQIETMENAKAEWIRIEIIPTNDADNNISFFEKSAYVKQLTVTMSRETKAEEETSEKESAKDETSEDSAEETTSESEA